ncbi:MAG TPA: hypothetical protein VF432_01855 [Thermoanaerobaculia bacterium]
MAGARRPRARRPIRQHGTSTRATSAAVPATMLPAAMLFVRFGSVASAAHAMTYTLYDGAAVVESRQPQRRCLAGEPFVDLGLLAMNIREEIAHAFASLNGSFADALSINAEKR